MKNDFKPKKRSVEKFFMALLTLGLILSPVSQAYAAAFNLQVIGGRASQTGPVEAGTLVTITADQVGPGKIFDSWSVTSTSGSSVSLNLKNATTSFTMPASDLTIFASFKDDTSGTKVYIQDGSIEINGRTVNNGSVIKEGTLVTIYADRAKTGKVFDKWTARNNADLRLLKDEKSSTTTFRMPRYDVNFIANYKDQTNQVLTLIDATATVDNKAVASGTTVEAGKRVILSAVAAPKGKVFDKWTANMNLAFENEKAPSTSFIMPKSAVTITATYKEVAVPVMKKQTSIFAIGDKNYIISTAGNVQSAAMEAAPYIENGRTMLPLRYVGEALGAQIQWNASTRQATCTMDGNTVVVTLGSKTMTVNGQAQQMDVAPSVVAGRTMLPLAWIGTAFGTPVGAPAVEGGNSIAWDQGTKSVSVVKVIK